MFINVHALDVKAFGRGGDPGKIRTSDLRFRKPSLYPPELQGHCFLDDYFRYFAEVTRAALPAG